MSPPANPTPAIDVQKVSLSLDGTAILRNLTVQLKPGGRLGIVGPPACGKSILLKLLVGLLKPDSGNINIFGTDIAAADERSQHTIRKDIGMLFQNYALFDFMTVGENIAFPLQRKNKEILPKRDKLSKQEIQEQVRSRLQAVGLADAYEKMPRELSGGMKKRVGIARATVTRPALVLYDEPTAGLDPVTTSKMYELLVSDQEKTHSTVIAVSSDIKALSRYTDEIAVLHDGKIHYHGPSKSMATSSDPIVRQLVTGCNDGPL